MEVGKTEWAMEMFNILDGLIPNMTKKVRKGISSETADDYYLPAHSKLVSLENLLIRASETPYGR